MRLALFATALFFVIALISAAGSVTTEHAHAGVVPCEDMQVTLRDAVTALKPNEPAAAKIRDLQDEGIERCSVDDDHRADDLFTQVLNILGQPA